MNVKKIISKKFTFVKDTYITNLSEGTLMTIKDELNVKEIKFDSKIFTTYEKVFDLICKIKWKFKFFYNRTCAP